MRSNYDPKRQIYISVKFNSYFLYILFCLILILQELGNVQRIVTNKLERLEIYTFRLSSSVRET